MSGCFLLEHRGPGVIRDLGEFAADGMVPHLPVRTLEAPGLLSREWDRAGTQDWVGRSGKSRSCAAAGAFFSVRLLPLDKSRRINVKAEKLVPKDAGELLVVY